MQILLFVKGNKLFPQCGFSNTAVRILQSIPAAGDFETVDVLADNDIREGIKTYSNWPTIPQVYVNGEFIGGCDTTIEMYKSGVRRRREPPWPRTCRTPRGSIRSASLCSRVRHRRSCARC